MMRWSTLLAFVVAMTVAVVAAAQKCHDVRIENDLPSPVLVMHCVVNDVDKGFPQFSRNQVNHFQVCGDKPDFFCHLHWGLTVELKRLLLEGGGLCGGDKCYFSVKSDGVYYSDTYPPKNLVKKFSW